MFFRRHEGNASARKKITRGSRIDDIVYQIDKVRLMEHFGEDFGYLTKEKKIALEDTRKWLEAREKFLESCSLKALGSLISGRAHYGTSKGMPVDLALGLFRDISL